LAGWLDIVDGVLLPGSPSNIAPHHYSDEASRPDNLLDPARDATTLPMIPQLVERGIPLLGICRGFQEMNVAFGGELHQYVQEQPGLKDHRSPQVDDVAEQYAPAHQVHFPEDSWLARWYGAREAKVNSLHGQGVRRLADALVAEAIAEDGLVEAFRVRDARGFAFAVQWHPEWRYADNPLSTAIFSAFGAACRQYRQSRHP